MKFKSIKNIALFLLAVSITIACQASDNSNRQYHDSYLGTQLCDTTLMLCAPSHNFITKALEIRASSAVKNRAHSSIAYGVAWGMAPDGSMYQAILSTDNNTDNDDIANTPTVMLNIRHVDKNGGMSNIQSIALTKDIDTEQCHNSLAVEINGKMGVLEILAGKNTLQSVAQMKITPSEAAFGMGIVAIGAPTFDVIVSEETINKSATLQTNWTITELETHLSQQPKDRSNDIEGFWLYLDRNNDPQYCRLGGKYRLAIVANETGQYDIIYVSGAETSASEWQTGMLKGKLIPTKFIGHYNLVWNDSRLNSYDNECSATVEQESIIRFDFPLLHSSIRFSKE